MKMNFLRRLALLCAVLTCGMLLALPDGDHAEAALEYIKNYPGITYEEVNN